MVIAILYTMFKLFKKKCPVCKTDLKEGNDYPEGFGKKFHSEECREQYRKQIIKERSKSRGGCCS